MSFLAVSSKPAAMSSESSNWIYLKPVKIRSNVIFRKTSYNIKESSIFASSPYGGPTAIANSSSNASSWEITIKTCAGPVLSSIKVPNLQALHWTRCHRLVVVGSRGRILVYNPLGKLKNQFTIEQEAAVSDSRVFHGFAGNTGLAVLTETNRVFAVNSVMEAVPWRIPDFLRSERPTAWNVITPPSAQMTFLFVVGDNFYAGMQGVAPQIVNAHWKLSGGEYSQISPNWDCSQIAMVHTSRVVQIISSDFILLHTVKIPTATVTSPCLSDVFWCGNDALASRRSRSSLLISSVNSECYVYQFDSDIRVDSEIDGIKVFTVDELIFISPVPEEVDNTLGLASAEPGAILFEASEKLQRGSHGVYDYIRLIENLLQKGVHQCLMAAAHQFDSGLQKRLLKAAALGKSLSRRHDASQFVDTCRVMRVLNSVRQPHIGIALSFAQSTELKMTALIDRLIDVGHWPLAVSLCEYMKLDHKDGVHRVLAHWALNKIEKAKAEKDAGRIPNYASLSQSIVNRFSSYPQVSFADVAMKAVEGGLSEMAELLLDKETRLNRQVLMLLNLNKVEKALSKAAQSQQPDLLHLVLTHLKKTHKKEVIDHLMLKLPMAMCLYQDYLREEAPRHVLALFEQDDDFARQAIYCLNESEGVPWNPFDVKEKLDGLKKAEKCLHNLKETATEHLLSESAALLQICESLDGKVSFANVDRTNLRSVFEWAAANDEEATTEQLKKTFKLNDKTCCIWRLEGFARNEKWHHLTALSESRKLPIGFMPFVEACVRYGNTPIAERMIEKLTQPEELIDAFLLIGNPVKAAKIAAEKKLPDLLDSIYSRYRSDDRIGPDIAKIINTSKGMA